MEFFEWASSAQYMLTLFGFSSINAETLPQAIKILYLQLWLCVGIAAAVYVACLVFGGIGLSKMAKQEGKKHAWMGFLPFLNTWYAGYVAGEANFFGQKMKRAGLYGAIVEGFYCTVQAITLASTFLFLPFSKVEVLSADGEEGVSYIVTDPARLPQGLRWLYDYQLLFNIVGLVLNLILIAFLCVIFIALFRKYYARSPILMTFLCAILPFRGFTLFAVRNNRPVDYNEYIRRRMEETVRRTYGPGPYSTGGPGAGPTASGGPQGTGGAPEEPFSDFGGGKGEAPQPPSDDDPFSDF